MDSCGTASSDETKQTLYPSSWRLRWNATKVLRYVNNCFCFKKGSSSRSILKLGSQAATAGTIPSSSLTNSNA